MRHTFLYDEHIALCYLDYNILIMLSEDDEKITHELQIRFNASTKTVKLDGIQETFQAHTGFENSRSIPLAAAAMRTSSLLYIAYVFLNY